MALSLSVSIKVGESPWHLSVEGGCFGKAISWTYGTHTFMIDQTEVRNAENVRKQHFVMNKKMFCVFTGQTTENPFRVTL